MKTRLANLFLVLTITSACSQGVVDFRNGGVSFATTADRLVRDGCGYGLVGTNYVGQLYWAIGATSDENALTAMTPIPNSNPTVHFRPPNTTAPGTWIGGYRTVGGLPGQTLTLQLRVWDIAFGNTWEQARGQGLFVASALFGYTVPQPLDSPDKYYIENFRGFGPLSGPCTPEPSATQFGLAAGMICFFARYLRSRATKRR